MLEIILVQDFSPLKGKSLNFLIDFILTTLRHSHVPDSKNPDIRAI